MDQQLFLSMKKHENLMEQTINANKELTSRLKRLKRDVEGLQMRWKSRKQPEYAAGKATIATVLSTVCCGRTEFRWGLQLAKDFPRTQCKGKYFHLKLKLITLSSEAFPGEKEVKLELGAYSAENPPKHIRDTVMGGRMVSGYPKSVLSYDAKEHCHLARFKVQVNELTSNLPHDFIFLVIQPVSDPFDCVGEQIQPLILDNIIVKATESVWKRGLQGDGRSDVSGDSDSD